MSHTAARSLTPAVEANVIAFCGDCHALPDPTSFPQEAWRDEVRRGFDFYYASGRTDLSVPVQRDVLHYFVSRAPQRLKLHEPAPIDSDWTERFRRHDVVIPGVDSAAVSFVQVVQASEPLGRGIVLSDMRGGGVYFVKVAADGELASPQLIGQAGHPAVVRVCDWDGDGLSDFLVADLGSFLPADHDQGRVLWFQQQSDSPGSFQMHTLHESIGRVAAIEVADFNGDARQDLLVAEFGWQTTGSIFWLERSSAGDPLAAMTKHTIDSRSGAIHVPVVDINGDGAPDFVALISQHHERVEAMINDGQGRFHSELIHAGPDASYGSSGIELVDLNGNGKIDVLYTNGDAFDSFILKPTHGVRWLENQGRFPFTPHELGSLPGAHRALPADFDGDGQLEIVAGTFIPHELLRTQQHQGAEALVVWNRHGQSEYTRHVLSRDLCMHAAMDVADLSGNGRSDLVVGNFRESGAAKGPALTIWFSK